MRDVAKLMELQLQIDQLIIDKKANKPIDLQQIEKINQDYNQLKNIPGIKSGSKGIRWIKSSKNIKGFEGDLNEFLFRRSQRFGVFLDQSKGLEQLSGSDKINELPVLNKIKDGTEILADFFDKSVQSYIEQQSKLDNKQIGVKRKPAAIQEDLEKFLDSYTVQHNDDKEILTQLKNNLPKYVDNLDKVLTKQRTKILSDEIGNKQPTEIELKEALSELQFNNVFNNASRNIKEGELLNKSSDTMWKTLSNLCDSLGLESLKKIFNDRDLKAKATSLGHKLNIQTNIIKAVNSVGGKNHTGRSNASHIR